MAQSAAERMKAYRQRQRDGVCLLRAQVRDLAGLVDALVAAGRMTEAEAASPDCETHAARAIGELLTAYEKSVTRIGRDPLAGVNVQQR